MDTLLIVIGVLLVALIGHAVVDPWPSAASAGGAGREAALSRARASGYRPRAAACHACWHARGAGLGAR